MTWWDALQIAGYFLAGFILVQCGYWQGLRHGRRNSYDQAIQDVSKRAMDLLQIEIEKRRQAKLLETRLNADPDTPWKVDA